MQKKLYRDKNNKMFAGVCSGIAKYFGIDPTLIRVAWAALTFFTVGIPGLILYILCACIIPDEPDSYEYRGNGQYNNSQQGYYQPPQDSNNQTRQ